MVDISHPVKIKSCALILGIIMAVGLVAVASAAERSVGSGPDDWWTAYPDRHPDAGSQVPHPRWVLDILRDRPLLILDHSTNCKACTDQEEAADAVLEDYGDDIAFENLIVNVGDFRAEGLFDVYDPDGGKQYIPLTIVLTLVEGSDGKVVVAWHSVEDATSVEWLRSLVRDAIELHGENVGGWDV